jgi:hypothetical protein
MHYFRICVFISLRVQLVFVILFDSLFLSSECIYNTYSLKIWLNLKYVDLKLWTQKAIVKCDLDLKQLFLLKQNFQCYTRYHNIVKTINILREYLLIRTGYIMQVFLPSYEYVIWHKRKDDKTILYGVITYQYH